MSTNVPPEVVFFSFEYEGNGNHNTVHRASKHPPWRRDPRLLVVDPLLVGNHLVPAKPYHGGELPF